MVVCKYFQQGYCRFGQNCRNEHVYGSKYSYHAPQPQNNPPPAQSGVTDEQLVSQVQADIQAALKGGQWILSSYAPFKEKPAMPGISDLSPEEARLFIYEAKANKNIDQAVGYMNSLLQETKHRYEQLLQPTPHILKVLRSLYKGEPVSCPFTNSSVRTGGSNNSATSVFRSAVQNTSGFGQNVNTASSIFGQKVNSVFGSSNAGTAAKSIFAQASQNVFGSSASSNVFGSQSDANSTAKSVFAQTEQNVFAVQPQSNPTSIFASASQQFFGTPSDPSGGQKPNSSPFQNTQTPHSIFQQTDKPGANIFGAATTNVFEQNSSDDSGIYSKMEELSQYDLEAFQSADFKLGFIPESPPPRALCI